MKYVTICLLTVLISLHTVKNDCVSSFWSKTGVSLYDKNYHFLLFYENKCVFGLGLFALDGKAIFVSFE